MGDSREMFYSRPWPFEADTFPADLGAVVQRTVLEGVLPALVVGHAPDGGWYVGDGENDPNEPGACIATHLTHVIQGDASISALAKLPPGYEARRRSPGDEWVGNRVQLAE